MRLCVHETRRLAAGLGIAALTAAIVATAPAPAAAQTLESTLPAASGRMDLLKWGVPYGEPASLDPARGNDNSPAFVASNTCDGLLRLTPDFGLEPGLATSWDFGADNRTLTFHLRDGIKLDASKNPCASDGLVIH